jgi:hypothetical protein
MADYYVIRGNVIYEGQLEVIELDRLATYFHLNQHAYQGLLSVDYLPGVHVSYDVKMGTADLKSIPIHHSITESYSQTITQPVIVNVLMAIARYAQFDLLKKINGLSEEHYPGVVDLKNIIQHCGVNASAGAKINTMNVANSLKHICKHINSKPELNAIDTRELEKIQSLRDTKTNMHNLKLSLQTPKANRH